MTFPAAVLLPGCLVQFLAALAYVVGLSHVWADVERPRYYRAKAAGIGAIGCAALARVAGMHRDEYELGVVVATYAGAWLLAALAWEHRTWLVLRQKPARERYEGKPGAGRAASDHPAV